MSRRSVSFLVGVGVGLGMLLAAASAVAATVVDFQDLSVPPAGYFNGNPGNLARGDEVSLPWISRSASFSNTFGIDADYSFPYWSGFAYSDVVNTTTAGFTNQYASNPGGGYQSTTYAVAYASGATVTLPAAATVAGFRIANTTYAYLAMREGDQFSPALAPEGWFRVTASGRLAGSPTGAAVFYLADLRGPSPPGIVTGWEWFDLSGLGLVDAISFAFAGSDVGPFGLNTPAYFALDDLTYAPVPEPGTWALAAAAAAAAGWRRGRRRRLVT